MCDIFLFYKPNIFVTGETIELSTEGEMTTVQEPTIEFTTDPLNQTLIEEVQKPTSPTTNQKKYSVPLMKKKSKNELKIKFNCKSQSVEGLRKIYFKKKIQLVYYQKKNEMQKFRHEQIKQDLNVKILKKQLAKAD